MEKINLKKNSIACLILLLVCACNSPMMNQPAFDKIYVGMPVEDVQKIAGEPYEIRSGRDSVEYYQYIERFEVGPGAVNQNIYILGIVNGQVVDKQVDSLSPRSGIRMQ